MPNYKITSEHNDLILSETFHEIIAVYVYRNNDYFELDEIKGSLMLICENKPADVPELGIKFEEVE